MSDNIAAIQKKMRRKQANTGGDHSVHQITPYEIAALVILIIIAILSAIQFKLGQSND